MTTLAELSKGESARVVSISGVGAIPERLLEMGLTPGADVRLIGVAPLGDPLEIELRGYRLSLRVAEANCVHVARPA